VRNVRSFAKTNYPLTVVAAPSRELSLEIAYDSRRFDADTIQRMLGHVRTLLEGLAVAPGTSLGALPMLTRAEQDTMLVEWNACTADYARDVTLHQLF